MHVALRGVLGERQPDPTFERQHVERRDAEDLRLAALEDRRAVHAGNGLDLRREGPDVGQPTPVDADLVGDHTLAYESLGERTERRADLLLPALEVGTDPLGCERLDLFETVLAVGLVRDRERLGEVGTDGPGEGVEHVVLIVAEDRELTGRLRRLAREPRLRLTKRLDEGLGSFEPVGDHLFGRCLGALLYQLPGVIGGLRLDHHDRDVAVVEHPAGDHHVEHRVVELADGAGTPPTGRGSGRPGRRRPAPRTASRRAGSTRRPR